MSDKLADSSEYRHGNMVFFDLLGVIVVAYPARVGTILNYVLAAATFLYLAKKASQPGNGGRSPFPPPLASLCNFLQFLFVAFQASFPWGGGDRLSHLLACSPSQGAGMCGSWPAPQAWRC